MNESITEGIVSPETMRVLFIEKDARVRALKEANDELQRLLDVHFTAVVARHEELIECLKRIEEAIKPVYAQMESEFVEMENNGLFPQIHNEWLNTADSALAGIERVVYGDYLDGHKVDIKGITEELEDLAPLMVGDGR